MLDFSMGDFDSAIAKLRAVLAETPDYFEARLSLGMAFYRKGDYTNAITEGHQAEKMRPHDPLVHTNLSLFYMKSGDKKTAEHHGLQARIASWRGDMNPPGSADSGNPELQIAAPRPAPIKTAPVQFPDMPWKKNRKIGGGNGADSERTETHK
jgi:tetratricopeptide (TPR) repeat protein